jgi:ABC-type enterochelin transport system permease subunit
LDTSIYAALAVPLAGGAIILGLLFYAHSIRFFSRFKHGVFLGATATIVAVCLVSAWAIGKWGYEAARHLMRAELAVSLDNVATIIQHQLDQMQEEGIFSASMPTTWSSMFSTRTDA